MNICRAFALLLLSPLAAVAAGPLAGPAVQTALPAWTSGPYVYDGAGNIRAIGSDGYAYDAAGRLVSGTADKQRTGIDNRQSYRYDSFGNVVAVTTSGAACAGNVACGIPVAVSASTNRLTSDGARYDDAGNLIEIGGTYSYAFDPAGMLTVQTPGSAAVRYHIYTASDERLATRTGSSWQWTLRDGRNRVIRTITSKDPGSGIPGSAEWVMAEDNVFAGASLAASTGAYGRRHEHADHLGSPRVISDDLGRIVAHHAYYPFGAELALTPTEDPRQRLQFTGHERDTIPGDAHTLDAMHARFYWAGVGRFVSVDQHPGRPARPLSWNRYVYALDNPLAYIDPDGNDAYIVITNQDVGDTRIYSKEHHQGQVETVPAYRVVMMNESGTVNLDHEVSRDTNFAGPAGRTRGWYVTDKETPPGTYWGHFKAAGTLGKVVELSDRPGGDSIKTPDNVTKTYVYIHIGTGCSRGCFLLPGGPSGRDAFMKDLKDLLAEDRKNKHGTNIRVIVQPRNARECSGDVCTLP